MLYLDKCQFSVMKISILKKLNFPSIAIEREMFNFYNPLLFFFVCLYKGEITFKFY